MAPATPQSDEKTQLRLCVNYRANNLVDSCGARGSKELAAALKKGIEDHDLPVTLETVHCMSKCHLGPTLRVLPDGPYIMGCQESDVPELLENLKKGDISALAKRFPLLETGRE
jgi:NADH:ubiquinone oxidoreductase subunit E